MNNILSHVLALVIACTIYGLAAWLWVALRAPV